MTALNRITPPNEPALLVDNGIMAPKSIKQEDSEKVNRETWQQMPKSCMQDGTVDICGSDTQHKSTADHPHGRGSHSEHDVPVGTVSPPRRLETFVECPSSRVKAQELKSSCVACLHDVVGFFCPLRQNERDTRANDP